MSAPLNPSETLFFEGNRLMADGLWAAAEACFTQALALDPQSGAVAANLAFLKERAGAAEQAEALYRQAIGLLPNNGQLYMNLGALLLKARRFEEAEDVARLATYLAPELPAAWSNLGVLLACMQREAEAEQSYRVALKRDAGHARTRFNLGYLLLRQGRFAEGWPLLEARWSFDRQVNRFACPPWRGEALGGKALVIGYEAGQGDMIQFSRYATLLRAKGAVRVAIVCHPSLVRLFGTLPGVDQVYSLEQQVPADGWDFWTLPMAMPAIFGTQLDSIPAPVPYLAAEPALVTEWAQRLPTRTGLRVGLAWKGNPAFDNDAARSLPSLAVLAPLAAGPDVLFISLQKGAGEHDAAPLGMTLFPAGPDLSDFADTAALIANLDLVISVDTAVAHLAGAMGKPCWLLLSDYLTDWRWLTARDDTPWYPDTMRLFRQGKDGKWGPVIETVAAALKGPGSN